jgi:hydroxyacylglutathione hydrolase
MHLYEKNGLTCERFVLGALDVNTYLVYDETKQRGIIIDPAEESKLLINRIKELKLKELDIYLTHGHADHILGVDYILSIFPKTKLYISKEDAPMLSSAESNLSLWLGAPFVVKAEHEAISQEHSLSLGKQSASIKAIPGHTKGGLVIIFEAMLFSGDTLFKESIGRSDLPGGDHKALLAGIKSEIFSLDDRLVFPGHGEKTSIAHEKNHNPFFNFL